MAICARHIRAGGRLPQQQRCGDRRQRVRARSAKPGVFADCREAAGSRLQASRTVFGKAPGIPIKAIPRDVSSLADLRDRIAAEVRVVLDREWQGFG